MGPAEPKDNDPTGEELAPEFDGTKTDQLDDSYRMRVASMSEMENLESDDRSQARPRQATEMNAAAPADTGTFDLPRAVDDEARDPSPKVPTVAPIVVDKSAGYDPDDTIIEAEPPKGFVSAKRNVKSS